MEREKKDYLRVIDIPSNLDLTFGLRNGKKTVCRLELSMGICRGTSSQRG